jgi:RimJ/RimL family protein N-acetyltransferase
VSCSATLNIEGDSAYFAIGCLDGFPFPEHAGACGTVKAKTPHTISFRPLAERDLPLLHVWLSRPHVAEWWGPAPTLAEVVEEYRPLTLGELPVQGFIASHADEAVGFIQAYQPVAFHHEGWWLEEHDPGVRGIDQFLANEHQLGRGLGTAMVREFVARLFENPAVTRVQTDPSPDNGRAIRAYEKAGFVAAGEVDTPDGRALLMYCTRPA